MMKLLKKPKEYQIFLITFAWQFVGSQTKLR